jgi:hypothetical protein
MTLTELQDELGELLRVKTKRYPLDQRTKHINMAIRALSQEFDSQFDEDYATFPTVASTGEYSLDTLFSSPYLTFDRPLRLWRASTESDEEGDYVLTQISLGDLLDKYPTTSDEGTPTDFAIFQRQLYLRPIPSGVLTIYCLYLGKQLTLANPQDNNAWTTKAEMAVIYRAAEYACIYLLEDERIQLFRELWQSEVSRLSTEHNARLSASRPTSIEPGTFTLV